MDLVVILIPLVVFLSVTFLSISVSNGGQAQLLRQRLQRHGQKTEGEAAVASSMSIMRDQRLSSFGILDHLLRQVGSSEQMALELARAAIPLRVGEYLLIRTLFGLVLSLIPALAGLPLILLPLFGLGGFYIPELYVKRRQQSRLRKINDQLVDVTTMIANSLKSGFSFVQGMEQVAKELPPPISEEVSQMLAEMSLGSNSEEALQNLSKRVGSYDLDLIATAMLIQRQVGGNLAEILENISKTIQARVRMLREVHALTSEARLSAYTVGLLPFFLMGVLAIVSRSYMAELLVNPLGRILLVGALVMEGIGFIVLRRIAAIEV
ncbi:MAG: type II secretion system F family protein [Chloroflexota bacterium]